MTDQELMDRILELSPEVGLVPIKTIEAIEQENSASPMAPLAAGTTEQL